MFILLLYITHVPQKVKIAKCNNIKVSQIISMYSYSLLLNCQSTTAAVERGFSRLKKLLAKQRNIENVCNKLLYTLIHEHQMKTRKMFIRSIKLCLFMYFAIFAIFIWFNVYCRTNSIVISFKYKIKSYFYKSNKVNRF